MKLCENIFVFFIATTIDLSQQQAVVSGPQATSAASGPQAPVSGPQAYPFAFMNITSDRNEECVIQILGSSITNTGMVMQGGQGSIIQFKTLQASSTPNAANAYNYSPPFDSLLNANDPANGNPVNNMGLLISSSQPMSVVLAKSDLGTTGGMVSYPMASRSVEFFIVGWQKYLDYPFLALIEVTGAQNDTCIEIYKIFNGTQYLKVGSNQTNQYQVYRYYASREPDANGNQLDIGEDCTGYYVNATKPVQVIFGHECAWIWDISILYCDYITEQMPPLSMLGRNNVVPPIGGRAANAGYVVRVVATANTPTTVKYLGNTTTLLRGQFLQFMQPETNVPTLVTCSNPCLVAQYNPGNQAVPDEQSGTDPYMAVVVPDDRFTSSTSFGTPIFCDAFNDMINFNNFVSLVTFASYTNNIQLDGQTISSSTVLGFSGWTTLQNGPVEYATCYFWVPHSFHYVTCNVPQCSFALYLYGHSLDVLSTSAYGMCVNYNITGNSINSTWTSVQPLFLAAMNGSGGSGCSSEEQLTGNIVSSNQYASFPFTLTAGISPPIALTPYCQSVYNTTLFNLLENFSKMINQWICTTQNCSYLNGQGVAINYNSLEITWIGSDGEYSGVMITVEMIASYDTSGQNFAQCRADIMNYMYPFINWPPNYSTSLIQSSTGCPWPIPFIQPQFTAGMQQCPSYQSDF